MRQEITYDALDRVVEVLRYVPAAATVPAHTESYSYNALGAFSFRVADLTTNTQLRVTTLDPLPVYSPVITVHLVPRIVLHMRTSSVRGVVRLFGTITPAVNVP